MWDVVIIDDDSDDIELLTEALKDHDVFTAHKSFTDPGEAMSFLKCVSSPPACVFIDVNMPRLNGYECLEILRGITFLRNSITVVLSTGMSEEMKASVKELGATLAFKKPDNFQAYRRIIDKVLALLNDRILLQ